jgi:hypothetical protein
VFMKLLFFDEPEYHAVGEHGERVAVGRTYHFQGPDSPTKLDLFVKSPGAIEVLRPGSVYQITTADGGGSIAKGDRAGFDRTTGQWFLILPFPGRE